ncbi:hypothetical protein N836_19335 [Leptolyngbya sp. Heron Island J]|nr:hypothetical protein N836_19335 [Leptolyngbya sp. Heron Island J]
MAEAKFLTITVLALTTQQHQQLASYLDHAEHRNHIPCRNQLPQGGPQSQP